jgi:GDP-4-dehydro-6-deoxy-D-mannose reductase
LSVEEQSQVDWRSLDLTNELSVANAVAGDWDAIVHLAGVSRHSEAERDPGHAWNVNAAGTARLCHALVSSSNLSRVKVLLVSTSDVYGEGGGRASVEEDTPSPRSTYAASKLGAEFAARSIAISTGLKVVVARPWPHTGLGQRDLLFPRWINALTMAKAMNQSAELKGDPETIRDYLSVHDVVEAYSRLLVKGIPGETYNVASGRELSFHEAAMILSDYMHCRVNLVMDPARATGARYSVGNAAKLSSATGWSPRISLEQTLAEMINAKED